MTRQAELREDAIIITKDQLWREGIRDEQRLAVGAIQIVDGIFHRLDSKGVVIKVERELPKVRYTVKVYDNTDSRNIGYAFRKAYEQAGYVATEPLVNIKS